MKIIALLLWVGTFLSMEAFAWLTHKYIMHGFMWRWHESHHVHHKNALEKNDKVDNLKDNNKTLPQIAKTE